MATSGSTDFAVTRDNIIQDAMWLIGALGETETIASDSTTKIARILNMMIKAWQAEGLNLWTTTQATVYLTKSTAKYALPGAKGSNSVVETELNGAASASATSLTVDSTTGMTASDVILIELDDDTLHSTTIVSVDSSTTLTITSGLASAAADNNNVYTYTTAIGQPLDILDARLKDDAGNERVLHKMSNQEYFDQTNKATESTPTGFFYDPQLSTGQLYIWPVPDSVSQRLTITYTRRIEDFDASGDNPDFPIEWAQALVYNLAKNIAPAYGKDQKAISLIGPLAEQYKQDLLDWDNGKSSVTIRLDERV